MMNNKIKSQKGSIIIEVIAVIALLAVLGPLLFRQITRRNEEVNNVNAATEIRLVKEAFTAYIQAYITDLNEKVIAMNASADESIRLDGDAAFQTDMLQQVCLFLPDTHGDLLNCSDENPAASEAAYVLHLYAYPNEGTAISGVNYVGLILPTPETLPEGLGLKRASRIANLIGADGGIYINDYGEGNKVTGVAGGWTDFNGDFEDIIEKDYGDQIEGQDLYLATTAVNNYEANVAIDDFDKDRIDLPDNLTFDRLHAYGYFSVANDPNCYQKGSREGTAENDTIYAYGENNCSPDFWVGAANSHFEQGHVYAKNALHIGVPNADYNSAFNFNTVAENDSDKKFTVYNKDGDNVVSIDATGKIVSFNKGDDSRPKVKFNEETKKYELASESIDEQLIIHSARIDTNIKAEKTSEKTGEIANYRLDPANMSVMNDIRLESKGGLKLSELLPDYLLKTTERKSISNNETVAKPEDCPNGMKSALVVVPLESKIKVADIANKLSASVNETSVTITAPDNAIVGTNTVEFNIIDSGTDWTVKTNTTEPIDVIIQKYCVFDKSTAPAEATLR